jgi:hypothetical protein
MTKLLTNQEQLRAELQISCSSWNESYATVLTNLTGLPIGNLANGNILFDEKVVDQLADRLPEKLAAYWRAIRERGYHP